MYLRFLFLVISVAWLAQAALLPADLHPALCPSYPYCDMELMARFDFNGMPRVQPVGWRTEWPANVPPAACPNYPFCNMGGGLPLPGFTARLYPPGVPAAACPDYPFC